MTFLSRDAVRRVDERAINEFHLPGIVLMENAGRGAVETLLAQPGNGPVVICAGKGNNGGDGFVMARHLDIRSIPVRVLLFAQPGAITGDAAVHLRVIEASGIPLVYIEASASADQLDAQMRDANWIVDALLGTGLQGEPRSNMRAAIGAINRAPGRVFAVDIPSGLDCDTGEPLGDVVRADCTATFVAEKRGFQFEHARQWTGTVTVVGIGAPRVALPTTSE